MGALPDWCPTYSSRKRDSSTGEEVFCICKKPDSGELMVGCDGCDDWFHFSCLKIPRKYNKLVFSFYCPYCQAGVTGPGSRDGNLPKTLWRRKCRVQDCFKPVADNSKYCSEEHARGYLQGLADRVEVRGYDAALVLRQMLQNADLDAFKSLGQNGVPKPSDALAPRLFEDDARLCDLESQLRDLRDRDKPQVESQLATLVQYVTWVQAVNELLFDGSNVQAAAALSQSQKRKRNIKPKAMCGYCRDLRIPCSAQDFAPRFDEEQLSIEGVCCKLRCSRHLDWAGIQENGLRFQLETFESSEERLTLLVKIREDQLKMQFYRKMVDHGVDPQPPLLANE
ncbi:LANO_0H15082g1_1 [Lachancea nothofagi CBS 11611]|uniref:LANO_0H15082g1_1 n=1 Tax=Lachancea nothofagi CBS 11611 TaxID=1266666 RepID=A0A1G4KMK1_9SACH|nr:LANO_0H15082g1_1 [Lachancea nothofagi CBS 11611]